MTTARSWLPGLALLLLAVGVYVPAMQCGFIWDDDTFLTGNPLIAAPDGLQRLWFSTEPPDYFPLTSTMLWLEWRLWGADPAGYHVVNVLLHAASCVLLWRVLLRLGVPGAWLAAALFAVHPVNVESVAWITQRKNTLPMVFALGSLLTWLRAEDDAAPSRRSYALALLLFLAALLSKTSVVVLAPLLLVCAWWRRGRISALDLRRAAPFFVLALVLGLVTVWYQTQRAIGDDIVRTDGLLSRLAIAGRAVWFYLGQALLPTDLCFVYPRWTVDVGSVGAWLPLAALVATLVGLWRLRAGPARPLLFALACFVLCLLPVLGLIDIYFMRYSLVADHWQHLALIGVVALVAAGLTKLAARVGGPETRWLAAGVLLASLATLTWRRQAAYRSEEALWRDVAGRNPGAWIAHNELGALRLAADRPAEAVAHFERALAADPGSADVRFNLGTTLQKLGRFQEAAAHLGEALKGRPDSAVTHSNLGVALQGLGRIDDAIARYQEALRIDPLLVAAHNNLGNALLARGRLEEAVVHYEAALAEDPAHAEAASNLGSALQELGRLEEAVARHQQAVRLRPDLAGMHANLGNALAALGRDAEAEAAWAEARRIDPALRGSQPTRER